MGLGKETYGLDRRKTREEKKRIRAAERVEKGEKAGKKERAESERELEG